jgi:hypothetical protein
MKLEERFQFGLLVHMVIISSKYVIKELGNGICYGSLYKTISIVNMGKDVVVLKRNIIMRTRGAHVAPT